MNQIKSTIMLLDNVSNEKYELEVYECDQCAGHIGFDTTFIEQTEETTHFECPYCKAPIQIEEVE